MSQPAFMREQRMPGEKSYLEGENETGRRMCSPALESRMDRYCSSGGCSARKLRWINGSYAIWSTVFIIGETITDALDWILRKARNGAILEAAQ